MSSRIVRFNRRYAQTEATLKFDREVEQLAEEIRNLKPRPPRQVRQVGDGLDYVRRIRSLGMKI